MRAIPGSIWSLKYPVTINGERMNLFDAKERGLIDINRDKYWGYYEFRVISTGEVISFQKYLNQRDWSDWYRDAVTKGPQATPHHHSTNKE